MFSTRSCIYNRPPSNYSTNNRMLLITFKSRVLMKQLTKLAYEWRNLCTILIRTRLFPLSHESCCQRGNSVIRLYDFAARVSNFAVQLMFVTREMECHNVVPWSDTAARTVTRRVSCPTCPQRIATFRINKYFVSIPRMYNFPLSSWQIASAWNISRHQKSSFQQIRFILVSSEHSYFSNAILGCNFLFYRTF